MAPAHLPCKAVSLHTWLTCMFFGWFLTAQQGQDGIPADLCAGCAQVRGHASHHPLSQGPPRQGISTCGAPAVCIMGVCPVFLLPVIRWEWIDTTQPQKWGQHITPTIPRHSHEGTENICIKQRPSGAWRRTPATVHLLSSTRW